jgi:hypothetical protein
MTEAEWLACACPRRMLDEHQWQLPPRPAFSDRKLRLFACACCRQVWHQFTDPRSQQAVEVAEAYADGAATENQRYRAANANQDLHDENESNPEGLRLSLASSGCIMPTIHANSLAWRYERVGVPPAEQAALLRDIFGNPFRPVATVRLGITHWHVAPDAHVVSPPWMEWNDGTIPRLARTIYDGRRFEDLPILADALEDAGCDNADILQHCRGPGPHTRGCWVVDLLLGKE